jgi:uncharacterized membrane protein
MAAHVFCTTLGLSGLACVNIWLAQVVRQGDAGTTALAARSSLRVERIVGPLLGIGILLGFWLAIAAHIPLLSGWLLTAYGLIVLGGVTQAALAVPWHVKAASGETALDPGRPALAAWAFTINMALLVFLMVLRPF